MSKLEDYLDSCRARKFCWKTWNCVHFAAGWVEAYEGRRIEVPPDFSDMRDTALTTARLVREGGGLLRLVTQALGESPVHPLRAAVGDVVFLSNDTTAGTLGICNGVSAFALAPTEGFVAVPLSKFEAAWKLTKCE